MKKLTVLYDANCFFCRECRNWLARERSYVELEFVPRQSPSIDERFPGLKDLTRPEDLVVVGDEGEVYRGPNAYIICLWALERYRELSLRLSSPWLRPFARRGFEIVSRRRGWLSSFLFHVRGEEGVTGDLEKRAIRRKKAT